MPSTARKPRGGGEQTPDESDMNLLAEEVSAGRSLSAAAKRIGVSIFRAQYLWVIILSRLGAQAR